MATTAAALPLIGAAPLPARYEAAKVALAECANIDECKDWADKAAALASYAKQADDDDLELYARKVRARAIRRCGELLREVAPQSGGDRGGPMGGRPPNGITRSRAANDAGLSEHQRKTALRLANLPDDEFDEAIESADPPTISALAERGTAHSANHLKGRDPADFQAATKLLGLLNHIVRTSTTIDVRAAMRGLSKDEMYEAEAAARDSIEWLGELF